MSLGRVAPAWVPCWSQHSCERSWSPASRWWPVLCIEPWAAQPIPHTDVMAPRPGGPSDSAS